MTAQNTTITGTVISNGDGSSLPGAHVILVPAAGGPELDNLTDDKGKFVVNNVKQIFDEVVKFRGIIIVNPKHPIISFFKKYFDSEISDESLIVEFLRSFSNKLIYAP
jgi:hypothetical protein